MMGREEFNAFLGAGTVYEGQLSFLGAVRIDGEFKGEIRSEGTLILGKDARVYGAVQVGQLILSGYINGEIVAAKKTILHKTANLEGKLFTPVLVMEEGARIEGTISMRKDKDNVN